jgi:3(or 17)beta-hydroxysteroid dehydrogenase
LGRLQDKVAVISGGAGGIGSATARLFVKEGAKVTIADRSEQQGQVLAKEIGCDFLSLDVTNEKDWTHAIEAVEQKHGAIHVLVNAAGIEGKGLGKQSSPETTTLEEWRRVHAINLDGTFLGCRTVLPVMKRVGYGSIINLSSMVAYYASPDMTAYGSSKAAVQQFSKTVALYGSRDGKKIRCNSVHPGLTRTRMLNNMYLEIGRSLGVSPEEAERLSAKTIPLGEIGEPEDIGYLIIFLASDEAKYVTGSEFQADGGQHLFDAR